MRAYSLPKNNWYWILSITIYLTNGASIPQNNFSFPDRMFSLLKKLTMFSEKVILIWEIDIFVHWFSTFQFFRVFNNSKLKCAHILAKRRTKMRTSKIFKKRTNVHIFWLKGAQKCAHILAKRRTKMRTSKFLAKSTQFLEYFMPNDKFCDL